MAAVGLGGNHTHMEGVLKRLGRVPWRRVAQDGTRRDLDTRAGPSVFAPVQPRRAPATVRRLGETSGRGVVRQLPLPLSAPLQPAAGGPGRPERHRSPRRATAPGAWFAHRRLCTGRVARPAGHGALADQARASGAHATVARALGRQRARGPGRQPRPAQIAQHPVPDHAVAAHRVHAARLPAPGGAPGHRRTQGGAPPRWGWASPWLRAWSTSCCRGWGARWGTACAASRATTCRQSGAVGCRLAVAASSCASWTPCCTAATARRSAASSHPPGPPGPAAGRPRRRRPERGPWGAEGHLVVSDNQLSTSALYCCRREGILRIPMK
jgi:hypothetical protein